MAETGTDKTASPGSGSIASLAEAIKSNASFSSPLPGSGGPGAPGAVAEQPEKIYTVEEVLELVQLPADTMYALTGHERWILGEREKQILAEKTAKALSLIMKIEPKWFVIASFVTALGSVYGTRAIAEIKERKNKKEEVKS